MNLSDIARGEQSGKVRLPRSLVFIFSLVLATFGHVGVPWGCSKLTARHGWEKGRPGWPNTNIDSVAEWKKEASSYVITFSKCGKT